MSRAHARSPLSTKPCVADDFGQNTDEMKNDNEARVLVLGLDNAGKTTILKKLSDEVRAGLCV